MSLHRASSLTDLKRRQLIIQGQRASKEFSQGSSAVERQAHNLEAAGSIPAPASKLPTDCIQSDLLVEAGPVAPAIIAGATCRQTGEIEALCMTNDEAAAHCGFADRLQWAAHKKRHGLQPRKTRWGTRYYLPDLERTLAR